MHLFELRATTYDQRHGGFGNAPKFPPHSTLRLLMLDLRDDRDRTTRGP
jgi:uncharacterized protein YyaL (SSP411 family)